MFLSHWPRARAGMIAAAALMMAPPFCVQAATPQEEEVMAVTQAAADAFRRADAPALERLLAPQFTLVGPAGDVQPRRQAFAEVAARDPQYERFHNHDMVAHVYGDAATVQGITSVSGRAGGQPFALDVRFTDTLIRMDGAWKIVTSHVTTIVAPPASRKPMPGLEKR